MTKATFGATVGLIGAFVAKSLGGWDAALITLLTLMAIDFATGLMVAGVFHKSKKTETGALSSNIGWKGLCKKVFTMMFVLVGYRVDITLGIDMVRNGVIIGYGAIELISIVENAGLMGLPVPAIIIKAIDLLSAKADPEQSNETNSN